MLIRVKVLGLSVLLTTLLLIPIILLVVLFGAFERTHKRAVETIDRLGAWRDQVVTTYFDSLTKTD